MDDKTPDERTPGPMFVRHRDDKGLTHHIVVNRFESPSGHDAKDPNVYAFLNHHNKWEVRVSDRYKDVLAESSRLKVFGNWVDAANWLVLMQKSIGSYEDAQRRAREHLREDMDRMVAAMNNDE